MHKMYFDLLVFGSEKFEATNNTVDLRLHLVTSYRLENGALQPTHKDQSGNTNLSFDRRKTVGDLRLAIYQVTSFTLGGLCSSLGELNILSSHLFRCRSCGRETWL